MRSRLERYQSRMTIALTTSVTPMCSRRAIGSGTSAVRHDRRRILRRMRCLQCTNAVNMIPLASACRGVRVECASTSRSADPAARRSPSVNRHMPSRKTPMQAAACTYEIVFGPRAGQKVLSLQGAMPRDAGFEQALCANRQGFSLRTTDAGCSTHLAGSGRIGRRADGSSTAFIGAL